MLSNLLLDELDKELERRGHRFCRYADDCNIYVQTQRAGERVMESVTRFLTRASPAEGQRLEERRGSTARIGSFSGFRFTWGPEPKRTIASKALSRFKERDSGTDEAALRAGAWTKWCGAWPVTSTAGAATSAICETPTVLKLLDGWIRRRLRALLWQQWRDVAEPEAELQSLGVPEGRAAEAAASSRGPWAMAKHPMVQEGLTIKFFADLGVPPLQGMMRT